ncbi:hypothetical protein LshimejAT787_0603470 [Lyophyllum shimeji]|uniref:HAM1-like N-terminal domain-containing protein n=1 Tax=Lyophyllum shimeji TaxID=47721 RepID=A0A9P3PNL8_LYOSH|nr:hypothetical protein LshimejAT787_0603470 [Lyophyllum shimeji]
MGSCLSCLRGESESAEREPLLPTVAPPPPVPRSPTPLEKAADILAALQSGKLPSQDQLDIILRSNLRSSLLQCDLSVSGSGPLSENGRRVVDDTRELIESILQFGMEKNMDNRFQDLLYQCSQMEGPPIRVDADTAAIDAGQERLHAQAPTHGELIYDTTELIKSLKALAQLLLTSSAFRLLLCDMFASTRELLAQVAADIGNVAEQVQVAAEGVEKVASIGGDSLNILTEKVDDAVETVTEGLNAAQKMPSPDTAKDTFITSVQAFIVRAHQDPRYLRALRTMVSLTRKYARKLSRLTDIISESQTCSSTGTDDSPAISLTLSHEASQALDDFKVLVERLASGHSLDPLLRSLEDTVSSIAEEPQSSEADSKTGDVELQQYLASVDHWLSCALSPTPPSEPLYASSRAGTRALEKLYDDGHILFLSAAPSSPASVWSNHLSTFLTTYDAFVTALSHDRSTMRLVNALSQTHADLSDLMAQALRLGAPAGNAWKEEALRDLVGWVIPRVMGVIGHIEVPMPRVEYRSGKTEGALDALRMGPGEPGGLELDLVPDAIAVKIWNETRICMHPKDGPGATRASSCSRMHVHVEGIRLAVRELGYYFRRGGKCVGYADQGLLSVEVGSSEEPHHGSSSSQGLGVHIEVAFDTDDDKHDLDAEPSQKVLFEVLDVQVSLPGVRFEIDKSRHWILNKILIQPLAGPVVARVVSGVVEGRIRALLEGLAAGSATVGEEARRVREARCVNRAEEVGKTKVEPSVADLWAALLAKGPEAFGLGSATRDSDSPDVKVDTQSSTTATLKGVVHTMTTTTTVGPPDSRSGSGSGSSTLQDQSENKIETAVAIGAGAMLFPDEAGPYRGDDEGEGGGSKGSLLARVVKGLDDTLVNVEETVDHAVELRDDMECAVERRKEREELERKRGGWRSRAFDI